MPFKTTDADFAERRRRKRERPDIPEPHEVAYYQIRWKSKRRKKHWSSEHNKIVRADVWKVDEYTDYDRAAHRVKGLSNGGYHWQWWAIRKFSLEKQKDRVLIDKGRPKAK
jgi:hypothetical protein